MIEPFKDIEDARALAQAIVDTMRESLLVLDGDLYSACRQPLPLGDVPADRQDILGRPLYSLGDGQCRFQLFASS